MHIKEAPTERRANIGKIEVGGARELDYFCHEVCIVRHPSQYNTGVNITVFQLQFTTKSTLFLDQF